MKRVALTLTATISGLIALLGFKTHAPLATKPQALPSLALPTPASETPAPTPSSTDSTPSPPSTPSHTRHPLPSVSHSTPRPAPATTPAPARHPHPAGSHNMPTPTPSGTHSTSTPSQHPSPTRPHRPPTTPAPSPTPTPTPTHTTPPPNPAKTYYGRPVNTQYGVVQVKITVQGRKITNAAFVALTATDPHSAEIHAQAGPQLLQQTLAAQSANIDGVSGASYTSDGYKQSLQYALDQAGLR